MYIYIVSLRWGCKVSACYFANALSASCHHPPKTRSPLYSMKIIRKGSDITCAAVASCHGKVCSIDCRISSIINSGEALSLHSAGHVLRDARQHQVEAIHDNVHHQRPKPDIPLKCASQNACACRSDKL